MRKIRIPNTEIRMKSEFRIPKSAAKANRALFRISGFGILSDFGFRISDLAALFPQSLSSAYG
jgi:hypothetical protein